MDNMKNCILCQSDFESDYRIKFGAGYCFQCRYHKSLDIAISEIEIISDEIEKYWDRLPGQLTGNPESRLNDVANLIRKIKTEQIR